MNKSIQKTNKKETESIPKVSQKSKEKIPITFNSEQIKLIEKYTGVMGNTKAEVIRNIVINWLLEKGGNK